MLNVQNKNVVQAVAKATYQANRKRNLLTIFAMALTTFLLAVVIALGVSYWDTVSQRQIRMQGMDYDIELSEPRQSQVEKIKSMDNVKYAGVAVKCAIVEQYQGLLLDKTRLYWLDETCWEKQTIPALESYQGHYPQLEHEVMFGKDTLKAMGISNPTIGMKLPVTYTTLAEQSDGGHLEEEFTLCGWYMDYSKSNRGYVSKSFLDKTGVKQTDFTQGSLKVTLENPLYSEADIINIQQEIDFGGRQFITADYDTIARFCKITAGLAALLLMIFASGYLFIYNTLYISISKDIRYYGQLRTVGMTTVQLKQIVYRQAFWNALAGIPAGLAAAAAISKIVVPQLLQIMNPEFSSDGIAPVKLWVFFLAAGFAMLADWIGCWKPAKIAGNCSAIEAVRYTGSTSSRKHKKREGGGTYAMAAQNLFRDKKQAVVILSSFMIAISIFFVINVVILENDGKHILSATSSFDMQFKNETTLDGKKQQVITEDKIAQIQNIKGVERVRKVTSAKITVPYQPDVYGTYYKELYKSRYSPGNYDEDMALYQQNPGHDYFAPRLIGIDKSGFEVLCQKLGKDLNWQDFDSGKTAVVTKYFTKGDNGITGKTVRFSPSDGTGQGKEYTTKIAAVGDSSTNPAFFAGGITPDLIVSTRYAKALLGELFTELINIDYKQPFSDETEQKVKAVFKGEKRVSHESKLDAYYDMKHSEIQIKVLGNCLGIIIAMLAVLNYLNMMAASVQNRAQELATLESIGMTSKQIRKMLRAEGAGYAGISIVLSLAIGLPASYTTFEGMNLYRIPFAVPWASNLILFFIIFILCMAVPVWIYQKTQGRSIIERLHNTTDA